jgi:hypothetical protein
MFNSYFHCNLSYCFESTASVKLLNVKILRFSCNPFLFIKTAIYILKVVSLPLKKTP